jgi:hypothetical protein
LREQEGKDSELATWARVQVAQFMFNLKLNGPIAQLRLERTPDKREVVGSTPTRPTTLNADFGVWNVEGSEYRNGHIACSVGV